MRITFESVQEQNIHGGGIAEKPRVPAQEAAKKQESTGAYSVNIGGRDNRVQKNGTYRRESMTAEDVSRQASEVDMDVQKMYMAVMSNSMSQEEFNQMLEDGINVSDTDIETMVTILDQIKVAVAKGGGDIAGFTDRLSEETLEQILGSSAYAQALEEGLEEGAAAYMVEQQLPPTPENIYRAKYSAGAYQGQRDQELPDMEKEEGRAFRDQIDQVIRDAGLAVDEDSRADAAFLLRHDIPLTEENLQLYEKVKAFEKDGQKISGEELKYRIAVQVYEGKAPADADLSLESGIYGLAEDLYRAVQEMTPETADRAVENLAEGKELSLKDLIENAEKTGDFGGTREPVERREEAAADGAPEDGAANVAADREFLAARRQLEEVRLRMTVEANIRLLRSGFRIDTAPMEQLIEQLKLAEEALAGQGVSLAAEAVEKIDELRGMPAYTLGFAVSREISFTIAALHERGSELQADFEKTDADRARRDAAKERYETMQTEPRADLGDSMRKAFRNVDDILTDMNREPSEENRRAVRMLGYNRLEISEENLERALLLDEKVQNLFRDMKPGRVLQMIRDGVDVLHTDIEELDAYLTAAKGEFVQESEDFARFLHKLDKNGGITADERESYVGIYRLIRQVEKADGRAEGYLLGSEAQLTMENLLAAVRSGKKGYMDYRIDENFSGVDPVQRGRNIVDQINAASYESPERYREAMQALDKTMQGAGQAEEAADLLRELNQPVTISNLLEASAVLQEDAGIYQKIEDYEKEERQEELEAGQSRMESLAVDLQDTVGGEESLREGMEAFAEQAEKLLREAEQREGVTEFDIRDMQQICRGIRFRAAIAKESRYQIPVKTEEGYTVMNLTVRRGTGEARAEISVETEEYGRLEAVFTKSGQPGNEGVENISEEDMRTGIGGSLFAETESGKKILIELSENVRERLRNAGILAKDISVMQGSRVRRGISHSAENSAEKPPYAAHSGAGTGIVSMRESGWRPAQAEADEREKETGQGEISAGELYQIAKIFLETVRK